MDALENIILRNSPRKLTLPMPSEDQMKLVYKAALRAPDHAWLRPSRFIQGTGDVITKLSDIFVNFAKEKLKEEDEQKLEKYKNAPLRAPMIIILVSHIQDHPKVPEIEQVMSTAAAAQNILLALKGVIDPSLLTTLKLKRLTLLSFISLIADTGKLSAI